MYSLISFFVHGFVCVGAKNKHIFLTRRNTFVHVTNTFEQIDRFSLFFFEFSFLGRKGDQKPLFVKKEQRNNCMTLSHDGFM